MKTKILIVDDDINISELLGLYIKKHGYEYLCVHNGSDFYDIYKEYNPDLILLDLMLPGEDGYSICKNIRKESTVPIIMISAKGESISKITGLDLGADDYIQKPFDCEEVMARIKSVLRSRTYSQNSVEVNKDNLAYTFNDLSINVNERLLLYKNKSLELPPKEFDLLVYLIDKSNQVVTREELLESIWGYEYIGDSRTVDVHIKRIRAKLKDSIHWKLATVWGVGYRFEVTYED